MSGSTSFIPNSNTNRSILMIQVLSSNSRWLLSLSIIRVEVTSNREESDSAGPPSMRDNGAAIATLISIFLKKLLRWSKKFVPDSSEWTYLRDASILKSRWEMSTLSLSLFLRLALAELSSGNTSKQLTRTMRWSLKCSNHNYLEVMNLRGQLSWIKSQSISLIRIWSSTSRINSRFRLNLWE